MKYAIQQSKEEINYAYSRFVDKMNNHVKMLSEEGMPIISIMAMIRELRRLNFDYLQEAKTNGLNLSESQLKLADNIHSTFKIDVAPAMEIGLFGEQEIKKVLVKHEYAVMAKKGIKYKDIKSRLSKKYDVSVSWIEKLIYRKTPLPAASPPRGETPLSDSGRTSPQRGEKNELRFTEK